MSIKLIHIVIIIWSWFSKRRKTNIHELNNRNWRQIRLYQTLGGDFHIYYPMHSVEIARKIKL